jgi:branched-chain amino acid transport system permease protein
LAVGLLQQLAAGYVSSLFSATVAFVLLLVVLVVRPRGLLGRGPGREDAPASPMLLPGAGTVWRLGGRAAWITTGLGLLVVLLLPLLLEPNGLTASVVIAVILFIAVLGLDLLMGYAGQVSLGQAGFMAIGAYGAGILATKYHLAPPVGLLVGLVCSLAIAFVLALITGRLRGLYLALATLGFGLLVDSLTIGLSELTGGPSGLVGIPSFSIGYTFSTPVANYYLVCGLAAVLLWVSANLVHTGYGRALQAIRADETAARALGIDVPFYKISVFLLSAAFASIAGSLYAFNFHFISPELVSTSRSLELVTMLVIGGEATLVGPLLGALVITALPALSQGFALFKTLAEGCLLVLILLYVPGGLLGGLATLRQRLSPAPSGRRAAAAASAEP